MFDSKQRLPSPRNAPAMPSESGGGFPGSWRSGRVDGRKS